MPITLCIKVTIKRLTNILLLLLMMMMLLSLVNAKAYSLFDYYVHDIANIRALQINQKRTCNVSSTPLIESICMRIYLLLHRWSEKNAILQTIQRWRTAKLKYHNENIRLQNHMVRDGMHFCNLSSWDCVLQPFNFSQLAHYNNVRCLNLRLCNAELEKFRWKWKSRQWKQK